MAILLPTSVVPITAAKVFDAVRVTASNSFRLEAVGVIASLDADATVDLLFPMPPTLPSGTAKLLIRSYANATSGAAKINPAWKSVAAEESVDLAVGGLNAEGTQTVTWAAGDAEVIKETKVDLDADTLVGGELCVMKVVFETTSWTLAVASHHTFAIIWE